MPARICAFPVKGSNIGTGPLLIGVATPSTMIVILLKLVGAPFSVSFAKTSIALFVAIYPLLFAKISSLASITSGSTIIVTVAVSLLLMVDTSRSVYVIVYSPGVVPAGTLTIPVAASNAGSAPPFIAVAGITLVISTAVGLTKTPFKVSLSKTLIAFVVPTNPLIPEALSLTASIGAGTTLILITASSQLNGFNLPQIL
ncbi:hypothetical protein D3C86_1272170 [compost metagenome]